VLVCIAAFWTIGYETTHKDTGEVWSIFNLLCDAPRQSTDPWKNHGQYVSCMTKAAQSFAADGVSSDNKKSDLVNAAAQSSCGY